jgi:hypothetical protein
VEEGKSQWLEIETGEAFWGNCFRQQIMASYACCEKASRPKKAKAHTYANKRVLYSMQRAAEHQEGLRLTKEPIRKRPPRSAQAVRRAIRARHQ